MSDIDPSGDRLGTQGRGMSQLRQTDAGTEISKEAEVLAEREQCGALGLLVRRETLPLGAADGTEENRIALLANLEGLCGKGLAGRIDRGASHGHGSLLKGETELLLDGPENLGGLGHDFGSDAVSGQHCNAVGLAHRKRMH
jgi:hypothetical protein